MPWKLTFRPLGVGRVAVVIFISILCLLFSAFTASAVIASPSILGAVFMCTAAFFVGWIWYWFMHRFSLETSLDDEKLVWKTGFRSGAMPLNEIENMRRSLGTKVEIESATMRITLLPAGGYELFLQEVILLRPDLALPKGKVARCRRIWREVPAENVTPVLENGERTKSEMGFGNGTGNNDRTDRSDRRHGVSISATIARS